jgi:hypothetical protein
LKNAGSKHCFKPHRLPTIYHPEKIVPQWYSEGKSDDFVVTIKLHPDKQGTFAEIEHTNIPDEDFDDITDSWTHSYFGGLIDFFEGE